MKLLKLLALCSLIVFTYEQEYRLILGAHSREIHTSEAQPICLYFTGNTSTNFAAMGADSYYYADCKENILLNIYTLQDCQDHEISQGKYAIFAYTPETIDSKNHFSHLLLKEVPTGENQYSLISCIGKQQLEESKGYQKKNSYEQAKKDFYVAQQEKMLAGTTIMSLKLQKNLSEEDQAISKKLKEAEEEYAQADLAIAEAENKIKTINISLLILKQYELETETFRLYRESYLAPAKTSPHNPNGKKKLRKNKYKRS
jgi:hypothetical protein